MTTQSILTSVAPGAVPELGPAELKARLERGDALTLLDVREPAEWEIANLGGLGARLVPLGELAGRIPELELDGEVVVICRSGRRSATAVRQLQAAGLERVWNLRGGILAWSDEVDPSVRKY